MTLEQLAVGKRTDKLTHHSYLPIYDRLFAAMRDRPEPVLEIGAWYGGSLLLWLEYFSKATIFGCELNAVPLPPDTDQRVRIVHVDAYSEYGFAFFKALGPFSVLIDDGPHTLESQSTFCRKFPGILAPGGIAVVEDVQSHEELQELLKQVPPGFHTAVVDLRHVKGRYDDLALLIWR